MSLKRLRIKTTGTIMAIKAVKTKKCAVCKQNFVQMSTLEAINKILSGERKRPNYILVDNLRNYYAKFLDAKDK